MRKILIILLFILCSCSKTIINEPENKIKLDYVIQIKNDTTYYYKIIGLKEFMPIIDSIPSAKQYNIKK